MPKASIGKLFIIAAFILISAIPIVSFNRAKNVRASNENRYLANFPVIFDDAGRLNNGIKSGFINWFNDHLGKRDKLLWLQAMVKVHILHQSSSEKVHIGKDGWFYYTYDNNLKIADGTYPLTESLLAKFAQTQQTISDYYKSMGMQYVLVLTPSKASVYPEYIGLGDYKVGVSPVDIAEKYLKQHTNIHVVNIKPANIKGKEVGAQFLKTDTHWTQLGSYTAYRALIDYFNAQGILSAKPVDVTISQGKQGGEISYMLGGNILAPETVPTVSWEKHFTDIKNGEQYERMEQVRKQDNHPYDMTFLQNESAQDKTLLIYGDSQWLISIPYLFGEHFKKVVSYKMNTQPNVAMDEVVKPDIIIASCSERYINMIGGRDLPVPKLVENIPVLPKAPRQDTGYWIGRNGICLGNYNGKHIGDTDSFSVRRDAILVKLTGWAADFKNGRPLSALYLKVGDKIIECSYGAEDKSVSAHFQNDNLKNVGLSVTFPTSYLRGGEINEISFIQISYDGTYQYEPITYKLQYH